MSTKLYISIFSSIKTFPCAWYKNWNIPIFSTRHRDLVVFSRLQALLFQISPSLGIKLQQGVFQFQNVLSHFPLPPSDRSCLDVKQLQHLGFVYQEEVVSMQNLCTQTGFVHHLLKHQWLISIWNTVLEHNPVMTSSSSFNTTKSQAPIGSLWKGEQVHGQDWYYLPP